MNVRRLILGWVALWLSGGSGLLAQPIITSFSPALGSPGDQITLNGSGFTSESFYLYFWQNQQATVGYVISDNQMLITVPSGITTGPIGIQPVGGSVTYTADDFLAVGPGPYISDFSPGFGAVNDLITLNGVHFTNSPVVKFNGTVSTSVIVAADGTNLTARVPAGATSGPITVTTSNGTGSSPSPFTVIGPGPYITGFSPVAGSGGLLVYIDGVHFQTSAPTNATFGGIAGTNFFVAADTRIQVYTPTNVVSGPITVNSSIGSSTTSSNFYVPPSVSSFTPASGRAGTNVTITGANFVGANSVTFNGLPSSFTVVNNTTIRATVPAGVTDGLIRVTTPAFSCFSATSFLVQPTLFGFSPLFGPVGTSVSITGTNLNVGTVTVKFNGVQAAAPTGVTSGHLTAVVPSGATTGPITVTTGDGSATSANNFILPATISSFIPNFGPAGTRVAITGQNFIGASAVSFNGLAGTSIVVSNNTTLGVTAPGGIVTGPISVTTPANTATSTAVYYGMPGITNFTPTRGTNGTVVTVSGTNFLGATAVLFNGLNASINSNNGNQIMTSVPVGAQSGPISVVGPAGTNTTSAVFTVDYPSDMQIWGTPSANPVTLGSNLVYTITIVNNGPNNASNVRLTNWLPASVTLRSATINQGTLNTTGNPITGNLGTMVGGATATFTATVAPHSLGKITNVMSISSDNLDPTPSNNNTNIVTLIQSPPLLSISLLTNKVSVSWAPDLTNYTLQARNSLFTNVYWSNVLTAPVISTNKISVIESLTNTTRVYRLAR